MGIVDKWDHFNKDTLGKQFVKTADSMALNIAEGYEDLLTNDLMTQ